MFNNNKKVNKDNGKSNFCITKHFILCVLQAETLKLREKGRVEWKKKKERCFSCPKAQANEIQKYKRERCAVFAYWQRKCLVMKTTFCRLNVIEDDGKNLDTTFVFFKNGFSVDLLSAPNDEIPNGNYQERDALDSK